MRRAVFILSLLFAAQIMFAQDDAENKKVEEVLKTRKVSVIYQSTPLTDVVRFFQSISELNFVFDPKLERAADIRVTIRVEDTPLKSALNLMLEPQGLAFCVKDGAVFISTKERIAEITGKGSKAEGVKSKPGEALFLLTDGSRVKGAIKITELQLKTAYGTLTIPTTDIKEIKFPVVKKEEGKESALTEDEVQTIRFTVTGSLLIDKFEVKTTGGVLSISKTAIEKILFQPESPVKLEPGKKEWETAAAGTLRTIMTTVETFRVKYDAYPVSETSARNATGNERSLFEAADDLEAAGNQDCPTINLAQTESYTIKYTRIDAEHWTCTADTDRTNLNDFYIDQNGVLRAAPSTGDGSQATANNDPYTG
jgi:hypothetical protein